MKGPIYAGLVRVMRNLGYVWYSVAAELGDSVARVIRSTEQRKLSAEQQAEAEKKIRSIVSEARRKN